MDMQTFLDNTCKAARSKTLENSPQLLLGELILKLKACNGKWGNGEEKQVYFDFCGYYPSGLHSWRGIYSELAFGFEDEDGDKAPKLSDMIACCEDAIGKTFTGYKGGDFIMSKNTPVWVSKYGRSHYTAIVDVIETSVDIILSTQYCES